MANFFEGLLNVVKHPLDEAKFFKNVATGKTSLKDAPGAHQDMMNNITVPILGNNKLSKNSDAVAGAIVGGFMAAPALAGMGAGGTAGAGGSTSGLAGGGSLSSYMSPSLTTGSSGFGISSESLAPSLTTSSTGVGGITPSMVSGSGGSGLGYGMGIDMGAGSAASGVDKMELMMRALSSVKSGNEGQGQAQVMSSGGRGGFRGVQSKFSQNPLLQREYENLYISPQYIKLT